MWLLLLLATSVAAAWGIQHANLTATGATTITEIAADSGVCTYTPGHLFSPPTAVEAAQARAAWNDWSQVCRYDPSRGFGAYPTADELLSTKSALGAWGTMDQALATLWTMAASLGVAATAHGLLVGSLSIFNPAFISVGWWLLLPEIALAQGGWLGAAALGAMALGGLGPRYLRRSNPGAATTRGVRSWLTPKRVGLAAGGWLATVGVLAAVYPNVAAMLPKTAPVAAERGAPSVGSPTTVSSGTVPPTTEQVASTDSIDAVTPAPSPFTPANGDGSPTDQSGQQTAELSLPSAFAPGTTFAGASGGRNGGNGSNGESSEGGQSAGGGGSGGGLGEPTSGALQTIATYFPATSPGTQPPTSNPTGAEPPVSQTPPTEASEIVAVTPIIDNDNPLPTQSGTLPGAPSNQVVALDPPTNPGSTPTADGPAQPGDPAQPGAEAEIPPPVHQVPEPGMLGLFALGAGLVLVRRRRK